MRGATWIEVSLTVDGELAEAVAEVLSRFAPGGVVIESTLIEASLEYPEGYPVGPLRVCAYLPADEHIEEGRHQIEEALWYLGRIRDLPPLQFHPIQEADWSELWKQHYRPIPVGQTLMIVPAWLEPPASGRITLQMDPGMAFGTGTHPTTQLCLEMLEDWLLEHNQLGNQAIAVIDVGCGSGILSIAALKLGAEEVLGVDTDPQAITATQDNAILNGVAGRLQTGLGSVQHILSGEFPIRKAPLVLANILSSVIIRLLDEGLADLIAPGGAAILSGILIEQENDVVAALEKNGMIVKARYKGDWAALMAQRL